MFIDGGVNAGWTSHAPSSIINYSSIDPFSFQDLISNRVVIEETNCIQLLYKNRLTMLLDVVDLN